MRRLLVILVPLVLSCSAPDIVAPLSVPLDYRSIEDLEAFTGIPSCGRISRVEVVDDRSEPNLGVRSIQDKNSRAAVTTDSDVAGWVRHGIEDALHAAGVSIGASDAPVMRVSVVRIRTDENVYHRAGYEGRITLSAELVAPNGNVCWQNLATGTAGNYGYAGSVENYQETLNHALDRTVIDLFGAQPFENAACRSCG